jgi:hypothetical protein
MARGNLDARFGGHDELLKATDLTIPVNKRLSPQPLFVFSLPL